MEKNIGEPMVHRKELLMEYLLEYDLIYVYEMVLMRGPSTLALKAFEKEYLSVRLKNSMEHLKEWIEDRELDQPMEAMKSASKAHLRRRLKE